jgi:selenocysteine lyase/cysteine desulfurase
VAVRAARYGPALRAQGADRGRAHPAAPYLAIAEALTFHQGIGGKRKEARLVHLRDSWVDRLLAHDRVRLHTSLKPGLACGIACVEIEDVDPGELTTWLFQQHRIIVTPIKHDEFQGIRVSPSVYTTPEEIGRFVDAMQYVVDEGLPA